MFKLIAIGMLTATFMACNVTSQSNTASTAKANQTIKGEAPRIETHLFQAVTIDLSGPLVSETDELNPFTEYVVWTNIQHESGKTWNVRGFFAADGQAEYTSANKGNIWRTLFTPQLKGNYTYQSQIYKGKKAAILPYPKVISTLKTIATEKGLLKVKSVNTDAKGFAKKGFLGIKDGYFYFPGSDEYWLKGGSNSPENMLGYWEVDGTYQVSKQARGGEAATGDKLHEFAPHIQDFNAGDPLWGEEKQKGKGLIGAINYMSEQGLNSQYFLTMNINGDGRDVWPFLDHKTFNRFDVSKLAQWNMVFQHMQNKGILLHVVTQETENENLLDDGDVGSNRKLYYSELIARFGHHNALVWNLGEENGPAHWTPIYQNDEQRISMAKYFSENDPYKHGILIHSHSSAESKDHIFPALIDSQLDGISTQVDHRQRVFEDITKWRQLSSKREGGTPWLMTMDEIGKWYIGAKIDRDDPTHDSLRQHVLWPTFLAGGAGVEWYSGARQPHNDLGTENFRVRESLWNITRIAREFIAKHVPIWELTPLPEIKDRTIVIPGLDEKGVDEPEVTLPASSFYGASNGQYFLGYLIKRETIEINMPIGEYEQIWLNPISGEVTNKPSLFITNGQTTISLSSEEQKSDWVILLKKK